MELAVVAASPSINAVRGVLVALGIAHFGCFRVQHGVQGLLHGAPDHFIQVTPDLALINSNNFAQWLCAIVHLGGPFLVRYCGLAITV